MMEEKIHIIPKNRVFRVIAVLVILIMMTQLFPPIVLGLQATNELGAKNQTNEVQTNEVTETQSNVTENSEQQETLENTNQMEQQKESNIIEPQEEPLQEIKEIKQQDISEKIIGELAEKRSLNGKQFLLEDGTILATVYPSNVHYEKEGKLVDINNSLLEKEEKNENSNGNDNKILENIQNEFKIKFAKKSNKNKLVDYSIKNQKIKWSLQNCNKVEGKIEEVETKEENSKTKLKNISSSITYENILTNIDLQYNIISNQVKENIILKDKEAIKQALIFTYDVGKLVMEKTENGQIIISEENSENALLILDTPYMFDNAR